MERQFDILGSPMAEPEGGKGAIARLPPPSLVYRGEHYPSLFKNHTKDLFLALISAFSGKKYAKV